MAPTIGFVVGLQTCPSLGFIVGIGIVIVGVLGVCIGATVQAPIKQRNELREMYANTASANFGAAYERYISMALSQLQPYLSQLPGGRTRIRHEAGNLIIERDDGSLIVLGIEPPGTVYMH